MIRCISIALAVMLGIALWAEPSPAQPQKMQVLSVSSADAYEQAQALTVALKRAVQRSDGWTLGSGDFSLEVMVAAFSCKMPPSHTCQQKIGNKVGTRAYVWGTLKRAGSDVVARLHLWENGAQKRETTIRYSANLTDASDDALLGIARNAFDSLVGAASGKVVINAGKVDGDVLIDGHSAGSIKNGHAELSVPVGEHEIRVRAAGYHEAVGTTTVNPGESVEVTLAPTPVGQGSPPAGSAGPEAEHPSHFRKIAGYTGIGVGGAIALTGGYFWLKSFLQMQNVSQGYKNYRNSFPDDVCDEAQRGAVAPPENNAASPAQVRDICDSNARAKTLAFILVPVGAVIAGVGTYLLLTDKSSAQEHSSRFVPNVAIGPHGGSVDLNVSF